MREKFNRDCVFVCIGSAKHPIDSFGPRVGSLLKESGLTVYGTMDSPVHALNCAEIFPPIIKKHSSATIIAIDAGIARTEGKVGKLLLRKSSVSPGKGVGKKLPEIGDLSLVWYVSTPKDCLEIIYNSSPELVDITNEMALRAHDKIISIIQKNEN